MFFIVPRTLVKSYYDTWHKMSPTDDFTTLLLSRSFRSDESGECLWEASDGRLRASLQGHRGMVMSMAWNSDGTQLASGGGGRGSGELFIWDVQSGERLQSWNEPNAIVDVLAWSPTGEVLISGSSDGNLRWWDTKSRECLRVLKGHQGTVQSLKLSPDGKTLASSGDDNAIQLWDIQSGEQLRILRRDRPYERLNINGVKGLTEAQKATLRALGAIEDVPVPDIQHAPEL
jgi:WD40 repeat protein